MQGRTVLSSFLESHHLSKSLLFIDKCSLPKAPFGGEVHQGRSSPARSNKLVYDLCLCILILETSYTGPKVRFDAPIESDWVRAPTPAALHWVKCRFAGSFCFEGTWQAMLSGLTKLLQSYLLALLSEVESCELIHLQTMSPRRNAYRIGNESPKV